MEQADLPFERFESLLLAHPHVEHVELQGEGESLLHPRFFDMVRALRERNIKVSLISNGSLISESHAEQMVAPVSYTHLDVYKRQAPTRCSLHQLNHLILLTYNSRR